MSKAKLIIILTVLVDVIGVGIVIPVMPYFVQSIGASALTITSLFAIFSLCSFFSAPLLGSLSDKFGRRPALIISIFSTAIGWFIFGSAKSIAFLFLGRIIDGMAAGNFPIAQSYLADISKTHKERTENMGIIGAVFGIGFIIGPVIGSLLSNISISFPFYFVGVLALLNTIAAYFFLPETNTNLKKDKKISLNPFTPIKSAIKDNVLKSRYFVLFLFGLAIAIQQSVFALYMQDTFNFNVSKTGYVMTIMGIIMVINQGYLLKNFWLKKFKESLLEVWLILVLSVGFFAMSFSNFIIFSVGVLIMVFGQSILRAVMSSRITGFANQENKGEIAGIMSALMTLGMIIGPLSVGVIYVLNPHLSFVISGIISFIAFVIMLNSYNKIPEVKYHHEEVEPIEVI